MGILSFHSFSNRRRLLCLSCRGSGTRCHTPVRLSYISHRRHHRRLDRRQFSRSCWTRIWQAWRLFRAYSVPLSWSFLLSIVSRAFAANGSN